MKISFINEKVFYRFIEFTSRLIKYELAHEDYKTIALNKKEANTLIEKKVKRLSDAFLYLLNQTSQIIDFELISTTYYLLTKKRIAVDKVDEILKNIYRHIDEIAHIQTANVFLTINAMKLTRKLEFSLLIGNYLLIKNEYFPVIFHETDKQYLKTLVNENQVKSVIELIYMYEYQTRHSIGSDENKGVAMSLDDLANELKKLEKQLKTDFNVRHLFIYGGMVKKSVHQSSDIDLLVDFGIEMMNYKKYDLISQIQRFLVTKLETKLDVLDFGYSLKHAEIKEMNNTIKIF